MPVTPLKGALARVNRRGTITQRFDFALNPEQVHRRIHWPEAGEASSGPTPCERLSFKLILDATDALERPDHNPAVVQHGIRPQLAVLQSFIQPSDARAGGVLSGGSATGQPLAPALLFLWGQEPAVPVRMVSLNVREELFDPRLKPLRASVWVELEVLCAESSGGSFYARLSAASTARMRELVALAGKPKRARKVSPKSYSFGNERELSS